MNKDNSIDKSHKGGSRMKNNDRRNSYSNEKRESRGFSNDRRNKDSYDRREERGFSNDRRSKESYGRSEERGFSNDRRNKDSYGRREERGFSNDRRNKESYGRREERGFSNDRRNKESYGRREERGFSNDRRNKDSYDRREERGFSNDRRNKDSYDRREERGFSNDRRSKDSYGRSEERGNRYPVSYGGRNSNKTDRHFPEKREFNDKKKRYSSKREYEFEISDEEKKTKRLKHYSKKKQIEHLKKNIADEIRLNRYIAVSGLCSRREADKMIEEGRVSVNGKIITDLGTKVKKVDNVKVDGDTVIPERKVYLILNKPKDYVTTMDDPRERKIVMDLIKGACKERIYPVGRLDRNTTGILLFTNDGKLTTKLTHPKYETKKIYHVFLDRPLTTEDMEAITQGIELEDGFIKPDDLRYATSDKKEIGIEIHSGKNRIVRRIFENFGYRIEKLDRVFFGGLTKKNLPRGKWRMLTEEEVNIIKIY